MSEQQIGSQVEDPQGQVEIDSWAAAFAALEQKDEKDPEGAPAGGEAPDAVQVQGGTAPLEGQHVPTGADPDGVDGNQSSPVPQAVDGAGAEGEPGVGDIPSGADGLQDGESGGAVLGISEDEISEYRDGLVEDVRDRTVGDIARAFIEKGIRHRDGKLGANIDDPDICKRDSDGVPRFYNPETGREFTGDNPRRQAQEWVDDYNRELADAFNRACEKYEATLMEKEAPSLAVLEFAPTYEKLDPIRRGMLESLLEDYEVIEDGAVVGYSVDLDKALAAVDRQVAMIQGYAKANVPKQEAAPTGPALDMGNSAAAVSGGNKPPKFNSIAEAMEWQQDQILAKMGK